MRCALWRLSFRPFFLFGSLFAFFAIGLWLAFLLGGLPYSGLLMPVIWHSHEMVFGFAAAIIAGFVLTAVQNWTGLPGVSGIKLQLLFFVWALARILIAVYPRPSLAVSGLDLLFFPLLAAYLIPYLLDPELKVERVFIAYFSLFFVGDLLVHLDSLGYLRGYAATGIRLGVHTVVLVIVFMGGRVIPFFTESSIAKSQPKAFPKVEALSHLSAWLFLLSQFLFPLSRISAGIALFTAVIHLIRIRGWYVRRLRRAPLIWILHVAYFWLIVGFFLSGLAGLGLIQITLAVHAFTVGAIGTIILGMITRVSLGHTGRRLHPTRTTVLAYVAIAIAAVVRVFGPLLLPGSVEGVLLFSGAFWMIAFGIFVFEFAPILFSPRIGGKS